MSDDPRTFFVYRAYAADGTLLYVGMSRNLMQRYAYHRASAPWFGQAARYRLDGPLTESGARNLERWRIARNKPTYNKVRTPPNRAFDEWRCGIERAA